MNKNTLSHQVHPQVNHWKHRPLLLTIVFSWVALVLSPYSLHVSIDDFQITFSWVFILPLTMAMAYGPKLGIVAGTFGLLWLVPFLSWPTNGWANILTGFAYCIWPWWMSKAKMPDTPLSQQNWCKSPFVLNIPFVIFFTLIIIPGYPLLFNYNPPPWEPNAQTQIPYAIAGSIATKSIVTMFLQVLVAHLFLKLNKVRIWLGLPKWLHGDANEKIVFLTFLGGLVTFIAAKLLISIFVAGDFPHQLFRIHSHIEIMYLITIIGASLVTSHVLIFYTTQKKYAQFNLLLAGKQLQSISDNLVGGFVYQLNCGTNGGSRKFLYISAGIESITGVSAQAVIEDASKIYKSIHPDDQASFQELEHHCIATLSVLQAEFRIITHYNKIIWLGIAASPQLDSRGHIVWDGVAMDITQRKEAEQSRFELERRLSRLMDNLPGMAYRRLYDAHWTMEVVSEGAMYILGYSPEELIGNHQVSFVDLIHPEDKQWIKHEWQLKLERHEQVTLEYRIYDKQGNLRWVLEKGQGVYADNGKIIAVEGFISDITEQKNIQLSLRRTETTISALFSAMTEAVLLIKLDSTDETTQNEAQIKAIECNKAYTLLTSISLPTLKNLSYAKVPLVPDDAIVMQVKNDGRPFHFECYSENLKKHFAASVVSLGYDRVAVIYADITQLKQTNTMLYSKNRELENYLYIASHDLRSPLINILAFSAHLQKDTELLAQYIPNDVKNEATCRKILTSKVPSAVKHIQRSIDKMDNMINALLEVSRTGRRMMKITKIPMNRMMQDVKEQLLAQIDESDAQIQLDLLPDCYGDNYLINQLFLNIISNAIKYRVPHQKPMIHVYGESDKDFSVYHIQDNGLGIEEKYQNKIWDVFSRGATGKEIQGEGIGLSLVRRIVEKHFGKIRLYSNPEKNTGSLFSIELPNSFFNEPDFELKEYR
jgi:PAS domain S-box-containing protein